MLDAVVPALPRKQIMHGDESHGIVGIEEEGHAACQQDAAGDEGCSDKRPAHQQSAAPH
jgi:hypothetical protein